MDAATKKALIQDISNLKAKFFDYILSVCFEFPQACKI
jgi:hypothetical protein